MRTAKLWGGLLLVCAIQLARPSFVRANTIDFIGSDHGPIIEFTQNGFLARMFLYHPSFDSVLMEIVTGPRTQLTVLNPSETRYEFGPGTIRLEAEWSLPDGSTHQGSWQALFPEFQLQTFGEDVVGSTDYPYALSEFFFGEGLFDKDLARYLGVSRRTSGDSLSYFWENIRPLDPLSDFRQIFHSVNTSLHIEASVPEPAIGTLLLVGILAVGRRITPVRRFRRGVGSRPTGTM